MSRLRAELVRGLGWLTLVAVCDVLDLGLWTLAVLVGAVLLSAGVAVVFAEQQGRDDSAALVRAEVQAARVAAALEHRPVTVPGVVDAESLSEEVKEALPW